MRRHQLIVLRQQGLVLLGGMTEYKMKKTGIARFFIGKIVMKSLGIIFLCRRPGR